MDVLIPFESANHFGVDNHPEALEEEDIENLWQDHVDTSEDIQGVREDEDEDEQSWLNISRPLKDLDNPWHAISAFKADQVDETDDQGDMISEEGSLEAHKSHGSEEDGG